MSSSTRCSLALRRRNSSSLRKCVSLGRFSVSQKGRCILQALAVCDNVVLSECHEHGSEIDASVNICCSHDLAVEDIEPSAPFSNLGNIQPSDSLVESSKINRRRVGGGDDRHV